MPKSKIVVLEGMSGTGKDTQIRLLKEYLEGRGILHKSFQEPAFFANALREYRELNQKRVAPWGSLVEAYIFTADRLELFHREIHPIMDDGLLILMNRSFISSLVYQGVTNELFDQILDMNEFFPTPDLAYILVASPEEAAQRTLKREERAGPQAYTSETDVALLADRKARYEEVAEMFPYAVLINANKSEEEVHNEIISHLEERVLID